MDSNIKEQIAMDKLSMDLEFAKNLTDEELSKKYMSDNDETEITEETPSSQNTALKTINGNGSDQYSQVAALAKKLHEEEKKKYEERKRRRAEQEKTERKVKRKITEEEEKLKIQETNTSKANSTLYQLFNDLQGVSNDFDLKIESPELVVVGMQSDGKSSFIEALLSFQFNIVESSIGTRRPLIIQMINDQSKKEPHCRFRKEESVGSKSSDPNPKNGSFSSSLSSSTSSTNGIEDCFETDPVPVHKLSDELNRRTNDVAGFSTDCVSSKPIILRVEYYACANLTIFDTPGFRLRGDEKLKSEIEEMVMEIIKPSHRIIICLEQSTVEWANTNSRHIVSRVDPNFERTILVNTKFDNRVKELRNANSANKYLSGENLPIGKKPFFISLPVKRELSPESFSEHIKKCYLEDYKCLLSVNFDESVHLENLGFFRLKTFLEKSLTENYHKSIVPTLQSLETLVRKTSNEIDNIKKELKTNTIENLKSKVNLFVQNFLLITEKLLEGSIIGSPDTYGQTLQEEKNLSNVQPWPNSHINYDIENSDHKLYGGAQFNRILNEFEYAAHSIEFPPTSINEVASSIGNSKGHNMPSFDSAASDIVQFKSKKVLLPLIEVVCQRTTYIMKRLFSISIEVMKSGDDQFNEGNCSILSSYDLFVSDLQNTFYTFVESIEKNCKKKLIEDFATFTKIVDWDLLTGLQSFKETSLVNSTPEQTKERVINLMKPQNLLNDQKDNPIFLRTRNIDQNSYKYICEISAKLFSGIRFFFVKYIRNKLNAFFLEPIFQKLGTFLSEHFRKMENSTYEKMFDLGIKDLENKLVVLQKKYTHCKLNRDRFKEICSKIKNYN